MKLSVFLQKRPDLSTEDFRNWWLEHVKLSSQIPGLTRYHINFVNEIRPFNVEWRDVQYDGTAELSFDGESSLDEGFESPVAVAAVEDADRHCIRRVEFRTEESIIVEGPGRDPTGMLKLVVLLERRPDLSAPEWREWWLAHVKLSSRIPGLRGYRINFIEGVQGQGFEESQVDFDGSAELWFDNVQALEEGFGSPIGLKAGADAEAHCRKRARFLTEEHVVK